MSDDRSKSNLAHDLMDDLLNEAGESASRDSGRRTSVPKAVANDDDRTMDLGQHHPDATLPLAVNAGARPRASEDRTLRVNHTLPVPVNVPAHPRARRPGGEDDDQSPRASVGRGGAFRTPGQPTMTEAAFGPRANLCASPRPAFSTSSKRSSVCARRTKSSAPRGENAAPPGRRIDRRGSPSRG